MSRVLIVDDQGDQRRAASVALAQKGFDVVVATSGHEALKALGAAAGRNTVGIDLALIELMMPDPNGLQLARQIRSHFPHVRVVLSSAYHLSARQLERADCGAVGFVPKPYRLPELCAFLRSKVPSASPCSH